VNYKLDIFRSLPDGQCLWVEAVESLEEAKDQLLNLMRREPGEYFIFDPSRGCRVDAAFATSS
jgi:hypothetical protein